MIIESSAERVADHLLSYTTPKSSTVAFVQFLETHGCLVSGAKVLDIGTATGDNVYYLAQKHPEVTFVGADYNRSCIEAGQKKLATFPTIKNASLAVADWDDLPVDYVNQFTGIINTHTFCCFKRFEPAVDALVKLNPEWLAFNSLFYDGPLDVLIHIRDYKKASSPVDDDPDGDFNIFSLPRFKNYLTSQGYQDIAVSKFEIPTDLPRPVDGARGTYTIKTEIEERAQFSGPVYLPWHFILAKKK